MDINWLKQSEELVKGAQLMNGMEKVKFDKFLNYLVSTGQNGQIGKKRQADEIFSPEELISLERAFKFNGEEVALVIKTTVYILERMSKFVQRPSWMVEDLQLKLKISREKAIALVDTWKTLMRDVIEECGMRRFDDVDPAGDPRWQLYVAVGSGLNKKEKLTTVMMDLKTRRDPTLLELSAAELYALHNQLESAQYEIDSLLAPQK